MIVPNLLPLLEMQQINKTLLLNFYLYLRWMLSVTIKLTYPCFQVNLDSDNGLTAVKRVDIMCFLKLWLEHPANSLKDKAAQQ